MAADKLPNQRFQELDALRGIAALVVVFHHTVLFGLTDKTPLPVRQVLQFCYPIWDGRASVILFFVLSGFVLYLPYARGTSLPYLTYLIRRIFRIYVPYLVALLFALAGAWVWHGQFKQFSPWAQISWTQSPNKTLILQHVLFIGKYNMNEFNSAIWSLVEEMRISLFFPLLALICLRLKWPWILLAAGLLVVTKNDLGTVAVTALFLVGILVAQHHETLFDFCTKSRIPSWILVLASLAMLTAPIGDSAPGLLLLGLKGTGAALLVLFSLHSPLVIRFLEQPVNQWLGKISYSLYLVHIPALFTTVALLQNILPYAAIVPLYLGVVLITSYAFHRLVESPAQALGKRLVAARLDPAGERTGRS